MEFTEAAFFELKRSGYTHIIHDPARRAPNNEDNFIHWVMPIKWSDVRHDFEEAEMFIQSLDDFEVADMARGMVGVVFKIKFSP